MSKNKQNKRLVLNIFWKFLNNMLVGRPIIADYNWILTPASIFVGHFLKEFYSKLDSILTDSLIFSAFKMFFRILILF